MLLGLYAIVFTYISLSQLTHERRLREVERLLVIGLLDAESGERGYLLTDNRLFLIQYEAGANAIGIYSSAYQHALRSEEGRRLYREVSVLLDLKRAEMTLTIATNDRRGPSEAVAIVRGLRGHTYTARIYDLLRRIRLAESRQIAPLEIWRMPYDFDLHDPHRMLSRTLILMRLEPR